MSDKCVQNKIRNKFNVEIAGKALRWIRELPVTEGFQIPKEMLAAVEIIPLDISEVSADQCHTILSNGLVLGYLMACLGDQESIKLTTNTWKVSEKPMFEMNRQRERIGLFLKFANQYGVDDTYSFQTVQLSDNTDMTQVIICLSQLGIEAQTKPNYKGPQGYWMNKHTMNKREFTEEQLRSSNNIIGLQMGTNLGANASGITFGATRHIVDMH